MTDTAKLDRAAVAAVDSTGQAAEIADLGIHLRDALWRVDSANIAPLGGTHPVVVAGMGGSGIGGRLAAAALAGRLQAPLLQARGYTLPAWVGADALAVLGSYSGAAEETLSCYDAAGVAGARRIVTTTGGELAQRARRDAVPVIPLPGGFQPRAAVGYSTVVALEAAALAGAAPSVRDEIESAATLLDALAAEWGPDGDEDSEAKAIARRLHDTVPVVMGAELAAPAAYRWKTQINENAKLAAFSSELPEANHNEVCGWTGHASGLCPATKSAGRFAAVVLEDPGAHPRNAARAQLTAQLLEDVGMLVVRVRARGESALERLLSLVLLGDLMSLYLAVLRGIDPVDIAMIDRFKRELAQS
jgi:glucose/mannose-6-phosphate isomerase